MQYMETNYKELIEYLDQKFIKLSGEIAELRNEVNGVKEEMATKVEVNKLLDAVDAYMKQGEDYRQEMLMLSNKINRHEKWILQLAEKLQMRLEY